jgi:histidine triad (HIT) family protein
MAKASAHCPFCDLIRGAAEVSVCYEDAKALAFMDIQPVNAGHVLVVPKTHVETLHDLPYDLAMHLFGVAMRIAPVIRKIAGADDMNIVVNSGAAAGQNVFHYHVHLIPRTAGDGFDIPLPFDGSQMPDRTLLDATAARIIAAMRDPMRTPDVGSTRVA